MSDQLKCGHTHTPDQTLREFAEKHDQDCCRWCVGDGRVADTKDGEAFRYWLDLPAQSKLALATGLVKPLPCPECDGAGRVKREETDNA